MMSWKEYFMGLAEMTAQKSKDPSSKVGCVIVDRDNRLVSQGFNGMIAGADESLLTYERPMKYHLIIHAEANALLFAPTNKLKDHIAYVTHGPCENCLKHLLQVGIRTIYYGCPGIMRDRGTPEQKEAIVRLIGATHAIVENVKTNKPYTEELGWRQT